MKHFKDLLAILLSFIGLEAAAAAVDPGLAQLDNAISTGDRIERDLQNGFGK